MLDRMMTRATLDDVPYWPPKSSLEKREAGWLERFEGLSLQTIPSSTVERPHAISPDQPSSEPPAAYEAPEPPPIASPTPTADPSEIATLRLNAAANIRSGPSLAAPIIGTAAVGAEIQVTAYDADWVQFVDPNTGKTGWVHSQSVEPGAASKAAVAARPTEELPQVEAPNRKPAKTAKGLISRP